MAYVSGPPPDGGGGGILPGTPDLDLVAKLVAQGFEGPDWLLARAVLADRAVNALHMLLLSDDPADGLEAKTSRLGRPIVRTAQEREALRDQATRAHLVHQAVVEGIAGFRALTAQGRGWKPGKGATVATYVINGCVRELANPYRAWRTERRRLGVTVPLSDDDHGPSAVSDVLDHFVMADDLDELLSTMPQVLAEAARLWLDTGWSWARIAHELGVTPRALEGHKYRWRVAHCTLDHSRRTGRER